MGFLDTVFSTRVALNGIEYVTRKILNFEGDIAIEDDEANGRTNIIFGGALVLADLAVNTAKLAANAVTNAKLRASAPLSVIGRAADSAGDVADIAALANDTLLRRAGDVLSFGALTLAMIPDGLITAAKLHSSVKIVIPCHGRVSSMSNVASAASYAYPIGRNEGAVITGTLTDAQLLVGRAMAIKNFRSRILTSTGNAAPFTFGPNVNGAGTPIAFTMAGNNTAPQVSSDTVNLAPGDLLAIAKVNGPSATATDDILWAFDLEFSL